MNRRDYRFLGDYAPPRLNMTPEQRGALFAGMTELLGQVATRSQRLAFATAVLQRPVRSFTSLSEQEAGRVLDHLNVSLMLRV